MNIPSYRRCNPTWAVLRKQRIHGYCGLSTLIPVNRRFCNELEDIQYYALIAKALQLLIYSLKKIVERR